MISINKLKTDMLAFFFPRDCVLCGGMAPGRYPLCGDCEKELPLISEPRCAFCGRELISSKETCGLCRTIRPRGIGMCRSLFTYTRGARELIYQYKFKNHRSLGEYFASLLEKEIWEKFTGYTLVPVPCNPSSLVKRGWDPVKVIVEQMKVPRVEYLLGRRRGVSLKHLGRDARRENVQGRFYLRKKGFLPEKVLLLDDMFTTGATAEACASLFMSGERKKVDILTIAIE